jgi:AcrR family transcriptional regulator
MRSVSGRGTVQNDRVERILDALIELLATRGPDALSIRNVASAAGVSVGAVQHHFGTKEKLLQAAMLTVEQRFASRIADLLRDDPSPESRLRAFCVEIAGLGSDDITEVVVWTVFAARSAVDDGIRQHHVSSWRHTEDVLRALVDAAYPQATADSADSAALLLAVLDGIAVSRAAERSARLPVERGIRILDQALAGIASAR